MKKIITLLAALTAWACINAQTDLIISEYVEGWSNNKAIELYNPTSSAINLSSYQLVRYSNGTDVPPASGNAVIALPSYSLEAYKTCVFVLDKRDAEGTGQEAPVWNDLQARADFFLCPVYNESKTMYFNGDDAVALEKKADGSIVDLFARYGAPRAEELGGWTTDAAKGYIAGGVAVTKDHTLRRKSNVLTGVTTNPNLFNALAEYDSLKANTFTGLGWHKFDGAPANSVPTLTVSDTYTISPLAENGDEVCTLQGADSDAGQSLEYYITDGNYFKDTVNGEQFYPFKMEKSTGKIVVAEEDALALIDRDIYMEVAVCDEYAQSELKSFYIKVTDNASVKENKTINTVLAPNPTKDNFKVISNEVISEVIVYAITGKEVYRQQANAKEVNVNVQLSSGIYMVKSTMVNSSVILDKLIVK